VRAAAALRLATLLSPALARLEQLVRQTDNPSVALAAVKEVLERNKLEAYGTPVPVKFTDGPPPPQLTTFNVSQVRFNELSDEGLDLVTAMVKGLLDAQRPPLVIDVGPTKGEGS